MAKESDLVQTRREILRSLTIAGLLAAAAQAMHDHLVDQRPQERLFLC